MPLYGLQLYCKYKTIELSEGKYKATVIFRQYMTNSLKSDSIPHQSYPLEGRFLNVFLNKSGIYENYAVDNENTISACWYSSLLIINIILINPSFLKLCVTYLPTISYWFEKQEKKKLCNKTHNFWSIHFLFLSSLSCINLGMFEDWNTIHKM